MPVLFWVTFVILVMQGWGWGDRWEWGGGVGRGGVGGGWGDSIDIQDSAIIIARETPNCITCSAIDFFSGTHINHYFLSPS